MFNKKYSVDEIGIVNMYDQFFCGQIDKKNLKFYLFSTKGPVEFDCKKTDMVQLKDGTVMRDNKTIELYEISGRYSVYSIAEVEAPIRLLQRLGVKFYGEPFLGEELEKKLNKKLTKTKFLDTELEYTPENNYTNKYSFFKAKQENVKFSGNFYVKLADFLNKNYTDDENLTNTL